jgi:hypothetical protein
VSQKSFKGVTFSRNNIPVHVTEEYAIFPMTGGNLETVAATYSASCFSLL